jgi:hypothetical protein
MHARAVVTTTFLWSLVLAPLSHGAPKYVKTYPGRPQPRASVALLARMEGPVSFYSVDGRTIEYQTGYGANRLELLPGTHQAWVVLSSAASSAATTTFFSGRQSVQFRVEAGRVYVLYGNQKGMVWSPSVVDITSSTDKKERKAAADLEKAFVEYRFTPAPHLAPPAGAAALMAMQGVHPFSIDDVAVPANRKFSFFFSVAEGRHAIVVVSIWDTDRVAPTRLEFTAAAGHVYAIVRNGTAWWGPWAPNVVDVTGEMDNIKENLIVRINKGLWK